MCITALACATDTIRASTLHGPLACPFSMINKIQTNFLCLSKVLVTLTALLNKSALFNNVCVKSHAAARKIHKLTTTMFVSQCIAKQSKMQPKHFPAFKRLNAIDELDKCSTAPCFAAAT